MLLQPQNDETRKQSALKKKVMPADQDALRRMCAGDSGTEEAVASLGNDTLVSQRLEAIAREAPLDEDALVSQRLDTYASPSQVDDPKRKKNCGFKQNWMKRLLQGK
jgi:hypothetical protein